MQELRGAVIDAFEQLRDGKMDITRAVAMAKLADTVVAGLKSEMQYAVLTNQEPYIPFYDNKLIENK